MEFLQRSVPIFVKHLMQPHASGLTGCNAIGHQRDLLGGAVEVGLDWPGGCAGFFDADAVTTSSA